MRAYYCDHFELPLPEHHRFPMEKYGMLRERVKRELPDVHMSIPPAATDSELGRVHTADYVKNVVSGNLSPSQIRRMGFPWSPQLVERSRRSVGGTLAAARAAIVDGFAANLAGGTHHAFADRGEGFCVFNDIAVAARAMQAEGRADRIAVLDLDVHQGNGTAKVFTDDRSVLTVSVHGESNYPFRKEQSDVDLPLQDGAGDREFLDAVARGLTAVDEFNPELLLYIAGADPFEDDRLGRLSVSKAGMKERDDQVTDYCNTACVPLAISMSGGYARDIADTVDIHFQSIRSLTRWARTKATA